jgi:glycosyltransferase involved in cell wall biosynthesis
MPNIKIISYQSFPYGGAASNYIRYFSQVLESKNNKIEVIRPVGDNTNENFDKGYRRKGIYHSVLFRHLSYKKRPANIIGKLIDSSIGAILLPIYLLYTNIKHKNDVVIVYNTHVTRIWGLVLFKKIICKKLIIILPEFYNKPKTSTKQLLRWYNFYLGLKYLSKYADAFIPLSHYMKSFLRNNLKINKPILILPNIMDPKMFTQEYSVPFKPNKITIGYAGTPGVKDGTYDLITSFHKLNLKYPQTHLLIIGDFPGDKEIIPAHKDHAAKLNVINDITFTGLVPHSEIPCLLNSCQILALTRPKGVFAEAGFPTKLGEYFACKKPVVVTKVGDIPRYFQDDIHVVLVVPEDIDSIVRGFEKIIQNKDLSDVLAKNAFEWMDENLNYRNLMLKNKIQGFVLN